jgi:hypothetical protein
MYCVEQAAISISSMGNHAQKVNQPKIKHKKSKGEETSSSRMLIDPWSIFLYGMRALMTGEKYRGRLTKFYDFVGLI